MFGVPVECFGVLTVGLEGTAACFESTRCVRQVLSRRSGGYPQRF